MSKNTLEYLWNFNGFRYIIGGLLTYLVKICVSLLLIDYFGFISGVGYGIALIMTIFISFVYNKNVTFKAKNSGKLEFVEYVSAKGTFHLIDLTTVTVLSQFNFLSTFNLVTLVTLILFFFKYFVFRKIFKEKN